MKKEQLMIVDGHVHIHPCFEISSMLDSALSNFRRLGCSNATYLMALSESHAQNYFAHLQQLAASDKEDQGLGHWQIALTEDADALVARKHQARLLEADAANQTCANSATIHILAGRQIVTEENLEVLALATNRHFDDGHSLRETIQAVQENGGIAAIPWGFGKWIGRRGEYLRDLLKSPPPDLFFADSSSRPTFWPEPPLFELARRKGLAILNGTDPFPMRSEMGRAGVAGFKIAGQLDPAKPATGLRQALLNASRALRGSSVHSSDSLPAIYPLPAVYGPLETPVRCFRNQLAMQFVKRFRSHV